MVPRAGPFLLVALTLGAWGGVLGVPFHYDDFANVILDDATRDPAAWWERMSSGVRPLLRTSYLADHALFGLDSRGYHATNLALHVATVLGVWALARRRLASELAALLAAATFAVQPAHAEVVAYVSGRSTGLMTALLVAALVAHERAREAPGRRRAAWHIASAALAVAACLTKEVALVFPALLAVWETRPARSVLVAIGLAVAVGVLLALSPRYQALAAYSLDLRGPLESLLVNLAAVPIMVSLWLRPGALSVDHAPPPAEVLLAAAGAALVAAAIVIALLARRRAPLAALAILWTLVALAPTSSVLAKADVITEKPLYLAWIGPSLAIGALARGRVAPAVLALALVLAAGVAAAGRVAVWKDPVALWAGAVEQAPRSARAWNNLGMACTLVRDDRRARAAFLEAIRLDPDDHVARANLARLLATCRGGCD
jgi:tetratricopeptide (TPR) repeat protein